MSAGPKIKCLTCGDVIQSQHRHDFVVCSCWNVGDGQKGIAVDGGSDYLKMSAGRDAKWEELEDD